MIYLEVLGMNMRKAKIILLTFFIAILFLGNLCSCSSNTNKIAKVKKLLVEGKVHHSSLTKLLIDHNMFMLNRNRWDGTIVEYVNELKRYETAIDNLYIKTLNTFNQALRISEAELGNHEMTAQVYIAIADLEGTIGEDSRKESAFNKAAEIRSMIKEK